MRKYFRISDLVASGNDIRYASRGYVARSVFSLFDPKTIFERALVLAESLSGGIKLTTKEYHKMDGTVARCGCRNLRMQLSHATLAHAIKNTDQDSTHSIYFFYDNLFNDDIGRSFLYAVATELLATRGTPFLEVDETKNVICLRATNQCAGCQHYRSHKIIEGTETCSCLHFLCNGQITRCV